MRIVVCFIVCWLCGCPRRGNTEYLFMWACYYYYLRELLTLCYICEVINDTLDINITHNWDQLYFLNN